MRIRGVIFDLDGTVLNTLDDLTGAVNFALERYGYPSHPREEIRTYLGNGMERLMALSLPGGKDNPDFPKVYAAFSEHYAAHDCDKTRPYPGMPDAIRKMREEGYEVSLVSNKRNERVRELNAAFYRDVIPYAVGETDGVRKKPAPDMVRKAAQAMGLGIRECVYVGDSEVDLETAENAGIPCLAVLWGFRTKEELRKSGAQILMEKPMDILSWLRRENSLSIEQMNLDMDLACRSMEEEQDTCVVCRNGKIVLSSRERGVKPLMEWIGQKKDLTDACAADRVVGSAAASLYALLGACAVYGSVMSENGIRVLRENGILYDYGEKVPQILNRRGDGLCPMEKASRDAADPLDAYRKLQEASAAMHKR